MNCFANNICIQTLTFLNKVSCVHFLANEVKDHCTFETDEMTATKNPKFCIKTGGAFVKWQVAVCG